jgi:hypothetical protein
VKIYRAMIPDIDGLPQVGRSARQLGVRPLDLLPHNDVSAATLDDIVNPGEGMSAAPNSPANLAKNRRPSQINGGTGKDRYGRSTPTTSGRNLSSYRISRATASWGQKSR